MLAAACSDNTPPTPTPRPSGPGPTAPPELAGDMPVQIIDRDLGTTNVMYTPMHTPFVMRTPQPSIDYKLLITNNTGKDLKAFRGMLTFQDTKGTVIEVLVGRFDEELLAGDTTVVEFTAFDNEYVKERQKLKETPTSDLVVTFKPTLLTLTDGSTEVLEAGP
jgi:hypothetical protein